MHNESDILKANQPKFDAIRALNLPIDEYAITGSGPLGIRGMRMIHDIDIIVTENLWDILAKQYAIVNEKGFDKIVFPDGIVEAFGFNSFYADENAPTISSRIEDAEVIDGLPFETLEDVLYFKRKMAREKDLKDIDLIDKSKPKEPPHGINNC